MGKTQDRLAKVKQQMASRKGKPAVVVDPQVKSALKLAFVYERVLGEYWHNKTLRFFTRLSEVGIKPTTLGQLKKAAVLAEQLEVDHETYVRAQFYWFHKWFRRRPKIMEMCSTSTGRHNAVWRVREYLKVQGGSVHSKEMPRETVPFEKLDKINGKRLEQLVQAWGKSPTEIIQIFAHSGVFDQRWLEKNETYRRLLSAGKL